MPRAETIFDSDTDPTVLESGFEVRAAREDGRIVALAVIDHHRCALTELPADVALAAAHAIIATLGPQVVVN